jgi:hypothetical protein
MSDVQVVKPAVTSADAILRQIFESALDACRHWAAGIMTGQLGMLLYPQDRGPIAGQRPYAINRRTVEKGIWRITLCPETALPPGVPLSTRDNIIQTQIACATIAMSPAAVDHVIQCGLFGEVIYP